MPDSFGRQERKTGRVKFRIQQELGAKPKTSKEGDYTPELTEWLVSTPLLVRAEEYSDGTRAETCATIKSTSTCG